MTVTPQPYPLWCAATTAEPDDKISATQEKDPAERLTREHLVWWE